MIVKPTVGRIVWFWPEKPGSSHAQPQAAIVAHVWSDTTVSLAIFGVDGVLSREPSPVIRLLQEGETPPETGFYATWMPYQIGQAKKHS